MSDLISSTQNPRVKLAYSLQQRPRARRGEMKIAIEGSRLIRDALTMKQRIEFVLYEPQSADMYLIAELQNLHTPLLPVTSEVMQYVSDTQQPQGILAVLPIPRPPLLKQVRRILILDAIREPGNLGTILRTAAAAGVEVALLSPDCVDVYNPKVLRAGMGAHFRLPIVEARWQEMDAYLAGIPRFVATGSAELPYTRVDFKQAWALIIGNEAHGASAAAKLNPTPIRIPMAAQTESLNAAIATAVICFEAQRQLGDVG